MCLSLYAAFKNAAKKSAQYLQGYRKNTGKLPSVKFTKCKMPNFAKKSMRCNETPT